MIKIVIIVLVPVNVFIYIYIIMRTTIFLECSSRSDRPIYSIYLNIICGFNLDCTLKGSKLRTLHSLLSVVRYSALLNCESFVHVLFLCIVCMFSFE